MKTLIHIGISIACLMGLYACDDLMDTHKEFIKDGEIIYAPKPDSIYFIAGKNRIELNYIISKAPHVNQLNLCWNNYQDSLSVPLQLSFLSDTGKIILDDLEEKSYTFYLRLQDKYGHLSLETSGFGTVYGDNYQTSLTDRYINSMISTDEGGIIEWNMAAEDLVRNEVYYTDIYGQKREVILPATGSSLFCPEALSGSAVEFRSVYIPEEACIDTFFTAWINSRDLGFYFPDVYTFSEVARDHWNLLFYNNSDPEEGNPMYMFDGNEDSYWHSDYHNNDAIPYPYTFIIDMQEEVWLGRVGAASRNNVHYSKGVRFYTTPDPEYAGDPEQNEWILFSEIDLEQQNGMQWSDVPNRMLEREIKGRYLKVVLTSGYNGDRLGAIAEIRAERVATRNGSEMK